jgi:predicted nucleotidyltransferase
MALHPSVAQHIPKIRELAKTYGVDKLEIFGSSMTEAFDPEKSDVDFIVHYPDGYEFGSFLKRFLDLEEDLSAVLHRPAQLVMTSALKHERFCRNANRTRTLIYDRVEADQRDRRHQEVLSASP